MKGKWLSLEEAKEVAGGVEWWTATLGRQSVPILPALVSTMNDNRRRPIWQYEKGRMYLGSWERKIYNNVYPWEHGFGINYCRCPDKIKGLVHFREKEWDVPW